jgi:hypothetical protein
MLVMAPMAMFVLVAQATAGAPPKPPSDRVVQVGVFSYGADGTDTAAAYETNLSAEVTTIYVAGCAVGAGNRPAPDRATDAWKVSGKVQTLNADEAVIQLDWQRIRTNGNPTTSPGGSVQLTLHPGDRVPLDSARPDAARDSLAPGSPLFDCPARTIGFEARYGSGLGRWVPGGGARGGGGGIGTGGGRPGAGSGGGGATIRSGAGVGAGTGGGSDSGRAVHMPKVGSAESSDSRQFAVDLWLVRNAPGRKEEAVHQALNGVRGSAQFAFAPVSIETARGTVNLQVTGLLRVTTDESGARQLVFITTRSVRFAPAGGSNRDTPPSMTGTSTTANPMPGPDDVLSFEMPPLPVPNGGAVPDQFEIRVRIR